jgi:hypothetical protein
MPATGRLARLGFAAVCSKGEAAFAKLRTAFFKIGLIRYWNIMIFTDPSRSLSDFSSIVLLEAPLKISNQYHVKPKMI